MRAGPRYCIKERNILQGKTHFIKANFVVKVNVFYCQLPLKILHMGNVANDVFCKAWLLPCGRIGLCLPLVLRLWPSGGKSSTMDADLPVLIAGAGPCGLLAAIALQRHGIPFLILERACEAARSPAPPFTPLHSFVLKRAGRTGA